MSQPVGERDDDLRVIPDDSCVVSACVLTLKRPAEDSHLASPRNRRGELSRADAGPSGSGAKSYAKHRRGRANMVRPGRRLFFAN